MNEQINKLLKTATDNILGVPVVDHTKFAELIVRECLDQLFVSDPNEDFDKGIAWSAKQIKEHFGVEE
jgi:hypothetical protein